MSELDQLLRQVPMDQVATLLGVDEEQAESAVRTALPALLGGMQANVADPDAALSLGDALGQHAQADYSGGLDDLDTQDGSKIVEHVFGANTPAVIQQLGGVRGSGGSGLISKLLPILAPIVLSYIARRLGERGGLGGVLGDGGQTGSVLDDILGQVLGGGQAPAPSQPAPRSSGGGGIIDILGGLLGGGRR